MAQLVSLLPLTYWKAKDTPIREKELFTFFLVTVGGFYTFHKFSTNRGLDLT